MSAIARPLPTLASDLVAFMDSMPPGFCMDGYRPEGCWCGIYVARTKEGWKVDFHHNEEGFDEDNLCDIYSVTVASFREVLELYQHPYVFEGPKPTLRELRESARED